MNFLKSVFLICFLFSIAFAQAQMPTFFEITQGYNNYFPLDRYFYNYQNIIISDMTSYQNSKNYRFCFIGQQHKPYLHPLSKQPILQYKNQSSQIPFNLDDILKMDKILDTFFNHAHHTLYVISQKQLKMIEILDNKIKSMTNTTLNVSISQAQFIMADSTLIILTDSTVFTLQYVENRIELKEINSVQSEDQIYLNVFMYKNNVVYVTDDSINLVPNHPANSLKNIKKRFVEFEYDIWNAFFYQTQKPNENMLLVFDQEHTFIRFNIDMMSNESLSYAQFSRLPQTSKCTKGHTWGDSLFLECRNHIIYIETDRIMKCKDETGQLMNECLRKVNFRHLNIGFHIKSIEFAAYNNVDFLIITGADKYEIRYLQISSTERQPNHKDSQKNITQILSVPFLSAFYPNLNIQKVYLTNINTTLILSKNDLLMASQIPQKKELFCQTVDQNSRQLLDQPAGNYNGTLTIEGFCLDMINQESLVQIVNENVCRLNVHMIVKVDALVESYQFIWYILLSGIVGIALGSGVYCVMKKRSLDKQYQTLKEEKENGVQVLQQTMVTEANNDETLSAN